MISKFFYYFGVDGLSHIIVCNVLVTLLSFFIPLYFSVLMTIIIALAKELIWDKIMKRGTFEIKDLIADAIGVIIGIL